MNSIENKENLSQDLGKEPMKPEQVLDNTRKTLKPVTSNTSNPASVTRRDLFGTQADNSNAVTEIASINLSILEKLGEIEIQTKQTGLDLDQLFERSKNNNEYLNKLLHNITKYSEEVVTEGNATKTDINKVIELLNESQNSQTILRKSHNDSLVKSQGILHTLEQNSKTVEEISNQLKEDKYYNASFNDSLSSSLSRLKSVVDEINAKTPKEEVAREIMNVIDEVENIKISNARIEQQLEVITNKSFISNDSRTASTDSTENSTTILSNLKSDLDQFREDSNIQINDILMELASATMQTNDISSIKNTIGTLSNTSMMNEKKLGELVDSVQKQNSLIKSFFGIRDRNAEKDRLESKILELKYKYDSLSLKYTEKFNSLCELQEEFQNLQQNIRDFQSETSDSQPNSHDALNKLSKIRKFHVQNIDHIRTYKNNSEDTDRRVFSTPMSK